MRKIILFLFLLILITACAQISENQNKICFKNHCYNVELAITSEEKATGLMYRESLPEKKGMLFIYDKEGLYSFWMKNTLIPLDIIWIDENQNVVYISKNTPPCKTPECPSYNRNTYAQYILELNAGQADLIELNIGDKLDFYLE